MNTKFFVLHALSLAWHCSRQWFCASKLSTPSNNYITQRPVALPCPRRLNLAHHIHAIKHLTEDDVLAVEMRRRGCKDEELRTVGVRSGIALARGLEEKDMV
jgi:hypothetical protein